MLSCIVIRILVLKMDPDTVKSTLSNLAFGNVLAAAARDYKKVKEFIHQMRSHSYPFLNVLEIIRFRVSTICSWVGFFLYAYDIHRK